MQPLRSTTVAGVGSALPMQTQPWQETRQGDVCTRERRQRCQTHPPNIYPLSWSLL